MRTARFHYLFDQASARCVRCISRSVSYRRATRCGSASPRQPPPDDAAPRTAGSRGEGHTPRAQRRAGAPEALSVRSAGASPTYRAGLGRHPNDVATAPRDDDIALGVEPLIADQAMSLLDSIVGVHTRRQHITVLQHDGRRRMRAKREGDLRSLPTPALM